MEARRVLVAVLQTICERKSERRRGRGFRVYRRGARTAGGSRRTSLAAGRGCRRGLISTGRRLSAVATQSTLAGAVYRSQGWQWPRKEVVERREDGGCVEETVVQLQACREY